MDNSTFEMDKETYNQVLTDDFNPELSALCLDPRFKALRNEGNVAIPHWRDVGVVRAKSSGDAAIHDKGWM